MGKQPHEPASETRGGNAILHITYSSTICYAICSAAPSRGTSIAGYYRERGRAIERGSPVPLERDGSHSKAEPAREVHGGACRRGEGASASVNALGKTVGRLRGDTKRPRIGGIVRPLPLRAEGGM